MTQPRFHGIIPPMITPLDEQGDVDLQGLEQLVDHIIDGGVHGLFVLGTTGEGPSLTMPQRQRVIAATCDQVAGRVPIMVGITDTVVSQSQEVAELAFAGGADAVVLAPPYYLPITQQELIDYCLRLADAIQLPIMLYNMPGCCKTWFDVDTVKQLAKHERIVGLKDSSGDLAYFETVVNELQDHGDFSFFVGPEELLVKAMRLGCHGGVNGGANMFPRLYTAMYEAAAAGDWTTAEQHQATVQKVSDSLYGVGDGPSRIIKGIKSVCQQMGLCQSNNVAAPFQPHTAAEQQEIKRRRAEFPSLVGSKSC